MSLKEIVQEKMKELEKELMELERMEVSKAGLRERFDDVIDLTENNPDFSVYMLRRGSGILIYCTDKSICNDHVVVFRDEKKAEAIVRIAKQLAEEVLGYLAFAANEFADFIEESMMASDVVVEEIESEVG